MCVLDKTTSGENYAKSLIVTTMSKTTFANWIALTPNEKVRYETLANPDSIRYHNEMDEYRRRLSGVVFTDAPAAGEKKTMNDGTNNGSASNFGQETALPRSVARPTADSDKDCVDMLIAAFQSRKRLSEEQVCHVQLINAQPYLSTRSKGRYLIVISGL